MKDFLGIFLMLLLIVTGICFFVFFGNFFGYIGLAILEIIIATAIILLAIRYFRSRRPK
jgi:hypothetical protein